jgi:hypothetical protein
MAAEKKRNAFLPASFAAYGQKNRQLVTSHTGESAESVHEKAGRIATLRGYTRPERGESKYGDRRRADRNGGRPPGHDAAIAVPSSITHSLSSLIEPSSAVPRSRNRP